MKLLCWNVNGLRSVCNKGFAETIEREKPDIVCLQETKLQHQNYDCLPLIPKGYTAHFCSAEKKGYSGVCLLLREESPFIGAEIVYGLGDPEFDSEGRVVKLVLPHFTLYNIYFPSGTSGETRQNYKYRFLDAISKHFNYSRVKEERIIVCGDFNICHKSIDIHHPETATKRQLSGFLPEERAWMDSFTELGFIDSFRHIHGDLVERYTWWSYRAGSRQKNLGWRIDYFFISPSLSKVVKNADILSQVPGSDHCPITLVLDSKQLA